MKFKVLLMCKNSEIAREQLGPLRSRCSKGSAPQIVTQAVSKCSRGLVSIRHRNEDAEALIRTDAVQLVTPGLLDVSSVKGMCIGWRRLKGNGGKSATQKIASPYIGLCKDRGVLRELKFKFGKRPNPRSTILNRVSAFSINLTNRVRSSAKVTFGLNPLFQTRHLVWLYATCFFDWNEGHAQKESSYSG
jgi:hypothetical protein